MSEYLASKCLFVGDSKVGKTSFIANYLSGSFPEDPPVVWDPPIISILYNDKAIKIQPWDTAGSEDYSMLRTLSYPDAKIIILCFSLADPKSLENIESYWIPEVKRERPNTPYIILGLKSDLRDESPQNSVSTEKGMEMKEKIGAKDYLECSSMNNSHIKEVFESILKILVEQHELELANMSSGSSDSYGYGNEYGSDHSKKSDEEED